MNIVAALVTFFVSFGIFSGIIRYTFDGLRSESNSWSSAMPLIFGVNTASYIVFRAIEQHWHVGNSIAFSTEGAWWLAEVIAMWLLIGRKDPKK